VFPEGVMYAAVKPDDVVELFDSHLEGGVPVERLKAAPAAW